MSLDAALRAIIREVLADELPKAIAAIMAERDRQSDIDEMSAVATAKFCRRRVSDVLSALKDGTLISEKHGRRWSVRSADATRWANGDSGLLSQEQAADVLGLKNPKTLAAWRTRRQGPVFIRIGHNVRYRASDLDKFIEAGRIESPQ